MESKYAASALGAAFLGAGRVDFINVVLCRETAVVYGYKGYRVYPLKTIHPPEIRNGPP